MNGEFAEKKINRLCTFCLQNSLVNKPNAHYNSYAAKRQKLILMKCRSLINYSQSHMYLHSISKKKKKKIAAKKIKQRKSTHYYLRYSNSPNQKKKHFEKTNIGEQWTVNAHTQQQQKMILCFNLIWINNRFARLPKVKPREFHE